MGQQLEELAVSLHPPPSHPRPLASSTPRAARNRQAPRQYHGSARRGRLNGNFAALEYWLAAERGLEVICGVMPTDTIALLVKRLRSLRESVGLTQAGFAYRAKMNHKNYQRLEAGRTNRINLSDLEKFAIAHGLAAWQLIGPKEPVSWCHPEVVKNANTFGPLTRPGNRRMRLGR